MSNTKMTLSELLASQEEKKILLLGREGIFTQKEIERFFKKYNAVITTELEEGVTAVIEHAMLNPVEEDISNAAYDNGLTLYKLKDLEKILSESINDDELLMGIKLANDQGRIFRLLGNAHINNTLFVKLLSMYEWDEEEEDSRNDRDVIMYTLSRYIDIKPNEQDLLYSYLTLRRLATEAEDPKLLLALIGFPNFEFLVRGKEKITLRETIARNENIEDEVIEKLISLRDSKVDTALASNISVPVKRLEKFLGKEDESVHKALASNQTINDLIFETLLQKSTAVIELLLIWQKIDMHRLEMLEKKDLDETLFALIGGNDTLEEAVVEKLVAMNNRHLLKHLAQNTTLKPEILEKIYEMEIKDTLVDLAGNTATPVKILETLYHEFSEHKEILSSLAYNDALPFEILQRLFEKDNFEINKGLATNASLSMEMLDVLKVDTRLQNYLAQNKIFISEYETVLDYDKKAVQF